MVSYVRFTPVTTQWYDWNPDTNSFLPQDASAHQLVGDADGVVGDQVIEEMIIDAVSAAIGNRFDEHMNPTAFGTASLAPGDNTIANTGFDLIAIDTALTIVPGAPGPNNWYESSILAKYGVLCPMFDDQHGPLQFINFANQRTILPQPKCNGVFIFLHEGIQGDYSLVRRGLYTQASYIS